MNIFDLIFAISNNLKIFQNQPRQRGAGDNVSNTIKMSQQQRKYEISAENFS